MAESSPTPTFRRERRGSMDNTISFSNQPDVMCDICEERKLKALKSCVMCQKSYCETHLQPHTTVKGLKDHKLMDPVRNLEEYICQKHKTPLERFCRDDQIRVCMECDVKDHMYHDTVSIEEESRKKKDELMETQEKDKQVIQDKVKKIQDIQHSAEIRKRETEKMKAAHVELFTDLTRVIERCKAELLEMMEEQQKAAEKHEQEQIEELEQEITEIETRNTELEQLSHTEDHLHLLQICTSPWSPTKTRSDRNFPEIRKKTHESQETLSRCLTQQQNTILEKLTQTVLNWKQQNAEMMRTEEQYTEMKSTEEQYTVDVTLDPDTAHPNPILSDDGKQVTHADTEQKLPDNSDRFDTSP